MAFFDSALVTNLPSDVEWRWPDMSWVNDLFDRAAEYLEENEVEAGWNIGIHAPILEWIFHRNKPQPRFLDYISWYAQTYFFYMAFLTRKAPRRKS